MLQKKLLMLVCSTSHESPWFTTQGTEQCIKVKGLDAEDKILLHIESENSHESWIELEKGLNPVFGSTLGKRYRLQKTSGPKPVPTTVEIYF